MSMWRMLKITHWLETTTIHDISMHSNNPNKCQIYHGLLGLEKKDNLNDKKWVGERWYCKKEWKWVERLKMVGEEYCNVFMMGKCLRE